MNLTDILTHKIQTAPDGFGVDEVTEWLKDIPRLMSFDEFENLFENKFTQKDLFALTVIIRNKYINVIPVNKEFSVLNRSLKEYQELKIQEDKSRILDLSGMSQLKRLVLTSNRVCENVILPKNSNLELIEIVNMPRLVRIENIETNTNIRYLTLRKCNKFKDFDSLKNQKNIFVLDVSLNNNITVLDFLKDYDNIRILHLIGTNAVKQMNVIEILSNLKMLRVLSIKTNQLELKNLKSALPNCFIN